MEGQAAARPEDPFAAYQEQLRRGHDALLGGDARAALEAYRAASALAGDRPLPLVSMGRVLLSLRRPDDALAAFEQALELSPHDAGAMGGKAEALLRLNRTEEAEAARRQLGRMEPEASPGAAGPATAFSRAEALTLAAEEAALDGRTEEALDDWLTAARAHAHDGHLLAALDVCQRALLADPASVAVHLEMSRLYLAAGLLEQAAERMLLLGRFLDLVGEPGLRSELATLAREHAAIDARLAVLAEHLEAPAQG